MSIVALAALSGCSMLEYIKPHQLYKLNRQAAPRSEFDYFSIPDPPRETKVRETRPM